MHWMGTAPDPRKRIVERDMSLRRKQNATIRICSERLGYKFRNKRRLTRPGWTLDDEKVFETESTQNGFLLALSDRN